MRVSKALEKQLKKYRLSDCKKYWVLDIEKENGEKFHVKLLEHHLAICQNYCWCLQNHNYAVTNIPLIDQTNGFKTWKTLLMHNLIANPQSGKETDHVNHNKIDNRYDPNDKNISNLQNKFHWQNQQNRLNDKGSSSKFVGVSKFKRDNKWQASITLKKHIFLGYYDLEEDAALAFNYAAILSNELTEHLHEDKRNMFILNGANVELNTAMRFGMVKNLPQEKLDIIKNKVSANL